MEDDMAQNVFDALAGILADGGADAHAIGLRVERSGAHLVVSFDIPETFPAAAVASRMEVKLDRAEAVEVVRCKTYTPPFPIGHIASGPVLAIGCDLPNGLGLEVEYLVEAARVRRTT